MRNAIQDSFIEIVRAELTGGDCSSFCPNEEVVDLALKHQLTHLVFHAYSKAGEKKYKPFLYRSIWMTEHQKQVLDTIRKAFNREKIPYIPLKGAVLRSLYPEEWMRNSCDIDILVQRADLKRAEEALVVLGYQKSGRTAHDISFVAGKVRVELHFTLIEDYRYPHVSAVLEQVWEYAEPACEFEYAMKDEMLYFYHISHMMKHLENGGCGVRTFADLWLLNNRKSYNVQERRKLLGKGELLTFASEVEKLSNVWFSDSDSTGTEDLEQFIFSGGVYGTVGNRVAIKKKKRGGGGAYLFSRLFVPYSRLKEQYPILQTKPFLLPFFEVVRWANMVRRKERYIREFKESVAPRQDNAVDEMLKRLGL